MIVFDLANQRLPISVAEDRLNKPWRPGHAGRVTPAQMGRLSLIVMPVILAITFSVGAWQETSLLFGLTWTYNDLQGGESIVGRNLIIANAFGLYNVASVRVACGVGSTLQESGIYWILIISAVIPSTMHLQDLKDVAGDKLRNRQMVPLVWGDSVTRWSVAVPVLAWSVVYPLYLRLGLLAFIFPVTIGIYLAFQMFWMRSHLADHLSWQV